VKTKHSLLILYFSLSLSVLSCGPDSSPPATEGSIPNRLTDEEAADGWILLFDGATLNNWEDPARETPPGDSWLIEDGCIKAVGDPRLREDLLSSENFGDFELTFEWKISPGGNSGVKYRVQDRAVLVKGRTDPDAKRFEDTVDYELEHRTADRNNLGPQDRIEEYLVGYEYQVIDNDRHPDAAEDLDRRAGSIYGLVAPVDVEVLPVGEFNQSRIVLRGNHVEHWLNGTRILEANLDSDAIRSGLERRWTRDSPVYRLLTEMPHKDAPIALQNHEDDAWFRNLKIRRLD
jgi:hypothetical protein